MADTTSSLASALLNLQARRPSPLDTFRKFGEATLKEGTSTAPVYSPLQGIARALQGGLGGLMEGYAAGQLKEQNKNNIGALTAAANAKDQAGLTEAMKGYEGDTDVVMPLLAQLVAQRQQQFQRGDSANSFAGAFGGSAQPATAAAPTGAAPNPLAGLPQGQAPASPSGFANNSGNIRSTAPGNYNGFATYADPQAGANAHFANYQAYVKQNPNITVAQALSKWSPPNENNTNGIISQVSESTGINPGMPLAEVLKDPAMAAQLLDAQTRLEKGGLPQGFNADTFMKATGGGSSAAPPTPLTINMPGGPPQGDQPQADGSGTPLPPSAASGPPEVGRPTPSADQVAKYKKLIADGVLTGPQAVQELDKEITGQWNMAKQQGLEVWKDQQSSKRQNEKAAIDLGQKAPMEMITKRVDAYEKDIRPKAEAAVQEVGSIHQVRQLLDQGAFTGMGAGAEAAGSRLAQALGLDWGADRQANTAALQSAMGNRVLALVKNLGAGTGISNADREYAEKVAGGNVTVGEPAMRKILDIGERVARQTLKSHDAEAERLQKLPGMAQLGGDQFKVQTAPTYEEWQKANPTLDTKKPDAPQTTIPTVNSPDEAAKLPKGTKFRTPDGRLMQVP
jgi:hypothetical protein